MRLIRQSRDRLIPSLIAVLFSAPMSVLPAQGRPLFEWSGRVDREIRIAMRGREVWFQAEANEDLRRRPMVSRPLPRQDGTVRVNLERGRGEADVIQQPSRRNNFTTIVRLRDRGSGEGLYRVSVYWIGSDFTSDNDRGRGRNGRDNSDDRDWGWGRGRDREQVVMRWSGQVDDVLEIRLQDDRIQYRTLSGKGSRDVHADVSRGGLPQQNVELSLNEWTGRGEIRIVQQPSRWNDYTAVIQIRDPRPSYGFYDFSLTSREAFISRR